MSGRPTLSPQQAAELLHGGGIVAYPTEAVWGLGCDPFDMTAVMRLLTLKRRPSHKGLIVIAACLEQLQPLIDFEGFPSERLAAVLATWPGPHTWIVPAHQKAPHWLTGSHDGIAVRVSAHAPVIALCEAFGGALVSTSANLAGATAPRALHEFDSSLLEQLDGVLDGETGGLERPSAIQHALTGEILRE